MKVLQVGAEIYPLIKTGGLADVLGALPQALQAQGADVRLLLPGLPGIIDAVLHAKRVAQVGPVLGAARVTLLLRGRTDYFLDRYSERREQSPDVRAAALRMAARLIAARGALGNKRQTIFCSIGGFDTHGDDQFQRQRQSRNGAGHTDAERGIARFIGIGLAVGVHIAIFFEIHRHVLSVPLGHRRHRHDQ